jgi:hypothetical protein
MNYPTVPQLGSPDQSSYSKSNLEFLAFGVGAIALSLSLLSAIGDGIEKRDICFLPQSKINSCNITKIATIPEPYFLANQYKSANPNYNSFAFLSSDNLTTIRHIQADNPIKNELGLGAVLAGVGTMFMAGKLRDKLNLLRPHYRATVQLEAHKAVTQLTLAKDLIDYSASELLKHIKHIKSAEAKIELLRNISPMQVNLLLMSMSEQDYHEFGYLLDGGKSFDKFNNSPVPHQLPLSAENDMKIHTSLDLECEGLEWTKNFLSTTCLVWGNQGSGKSWLARFLLKEKAAMGYQLVVLDPNSNNYEWQGVTLYNTYEAIESFMKQYITEVMGRYEAFGKSNISEEEWRSNLWREGKAISVLCEEVSTYADFISDKELLAKFFKVALTLSRKQEMPCIFVSHNNTQACLGGISGMSKLIERSQQLQPLATTDPVTKQPVSSGKGLIKIENSNQWVSVQLPKLSEKIRNFAVESDRTPEPTSNNNDVVENLERLYNTKPALSPEAKALLDYLIRTEKKLVTASSVQPCFKQDGKRFTSEQLRSWLAELGNCGYGEWNGNVLKLNQN